MVHCGDRFSRMDALGRTGVLRVFFCNFLHMNIKYLEVGVFQLMSPKTYDPWAAVVGNSRPKLR
jgi:hypothetical protein